MDEGKQLRPGRPRKTAAEKNKKDPGVLLQQYLGQSSSAEETLFKINELLYSGPFENVRKHPRAPIAVAVSYRIDGAAFKSNSYTLSQRGIFIKATEPPAPGTELELEFSLPGDPAPVRASGEVVQSAALDEAMKRTSLSGMSVVFTRISREDRLRIERAVKIFLKKNPREMR